MKFCIFFLVAFLQTSSMFAQTETLTTEYLYDPDAKFILNQVSVKMKRDTTKISSFTIVTKKPNEKTDTVRGEMTLKRYKYKLVLVKQETGRVL